MSFSCPNIAMPAMRKAWRLLMNPQDRRQNENQACEVGEAFSLSVWVGGVSVPLTLALSRRQRERTSCVFSTRASFSLATCAQLFNAETPARPSAFDSPRSGRRFSLSPRERAGVRGKSLVPVYQIHAQPFDVTPHPVPSFQGEMECSTGVWCIL